MTDKLLIAWSKKVILSADLLEEKKQREDVVVPVEELDTQNEEYTQPKHVTLKTIQFQLHAKSTKLDKKPKKEGIKLMKSKTEKNSTLQ